MLAHTVAHGIYTAASWPEVVACTFPGCVMRRTAHGAPSNWACSEHDDRAQRHVLDVGLALAEQAHADLTAPAPTTYDDPPRERRYSPRPTRRLDRDWRPDDAA